MEHLSDWLGRDVLNRLYDSLFSPRNVPWLKSVTTLAVLVVIYTILKYTVLVDEDETPVNFTVPVPKQCSPGWKGELLNEPSIKVSVMN